MVEDQRESDLENRSEILLCYDVKDNNPNGDPLSANNRPRIDDDTGQAVVTDVRLKRFIRDQLYDDEYGVYIRNPQKSGVKETRDELAMNLLEDMDVDDLTDLPPEEVVDALCNAAVDVRYFGATFSFNNQLQDANLPSLTGPIQFNHGRSLNEVVEKNESKKMSTVVKTDDDADQGTFAEDNRLEYAFMLFNGVVNENAAGNTGLDQEDVELLDSLVWRSLKNQTLTRSKIGHNPRLYVRVEYESGFHTGNLTEMVSMNDGESVPETQIRNVSDFVVDVTDLVDHLNNISDRVVAVHVTMDKYLTISYDDTLGGREVLENKLDTDVEEISVYE